MSIRMLVDDTLVPDDGCMSVINDFEKKTGCNFIVYPDVHLKKNSKMANGTLIYSDDSIFLSCLGIENCGFTFGSVNCLDKEKIVDSFKSYAQFLRKRNDLKQYTTAEIRKKLESAIEKDYYENGSLYKFLEFDGYLEAIQKSKEVINERMLVLASMNLGTLGGGNHFFEIHEIVDGSDDIDWLSDGKYIFMLHSDSISVGDYVFNLYSDLYEMKNNTSNRVKGMMAAFLFDYRRKKYFESIGIDAKRGDILTLRNDKDIYKSISAHSIIGKNLIFAHRIASLFGDMNRKAILDNWSNSQNITYEIQGNHSHDILSVEEHYGKNVIVHRNGVQLIKHDNFCILPGAMGTSSYVLKNPENGDAFYSTNHGAGRMQDKHIARDIYDEKETCMELAKRDIMLIKIKNGNMAEQNMKAFKNPEAVMAQMEKYNLAKPLARTIPIAIIKE